MLKECLGMNLHFLKTSILKIHSPTTVWIYSNWSGRNKFNNFTKMKNKANTNYIILSSIYICIILPWTSTTMSLVRDWFWPKTWFDAVQLRLYSLTVLKINTGPWVWLPVSLFVQTNVGRQPSAVAVTLEPTGTIAPPVGRLNCKLFTIASLPWDNKYNGTNTTV